MHKSSFMELLFIKKKRKLDLEPGLHSASYAPNTCFSKVNLPLIA
jgi:hypothetical protein